MDRSKLRPIGEKELRVCLSDNVDRLRRLKTYPPIKEAGESLGAYMTRMVELRYQILGMIWLVKDELVARGYEVDR